MLKIERPPEKSTCQENHCPSFNKDYMFKYHIDIKYLCENRHRYQSEGKWLSKVHNVHFQLNRTCVLHDIFVQSQEPLKSINKWTGEAAVWSDFCRFKAGWGSIYDLGYRKTNN